jgi:hypothetical protein
MRRVSAALGGALTDIDAPFRSPTTPSEVARLLDVVGKIFVGNYPCSPHEGTSGVESRVVDPDDLDAVASGFHGEDDLQLLSGFPAESVDLVYLDSPFFSRWVHEGSWADRAEMESLKDRWTGGVRTYLDWIADPLDDLHRILKPTGALFLICDEAVGLYIRFLLEELFSQRDPGNRMVWWKADTGAAHHYVFYYRRSGQSLGRHGHLYTVVHREEKDDWALVAFSLVRGRLRRRPSNRLG